MEGKDKKALASIAAAEVMVKEVKTVPESMRVRDLIHWLAFMEVSGAPVVDKGGRLVGVISEADIVKAQAFLGEENRFCSSFYEYDPFAGQVGYFEECSLKVLEMPVGDLMNREVITCFPQDSLSLVIHRLLTHHIQRLIVTADERIVGLVSILDILQALAAGRIALSKPYRIADLPLPPVSAIGEDMTIRELIDLLAGKAVSGLPVVRKDGRVTGVISRTDIVKSEAGTLRRRHRYADFYSPDPAKKHVILVSDFDREVLERRVSEFMNPRLISVHPDAPLASAAQTMVSAQVHRLLVLDQDGRLQGVVGTLDLMKVLA